VTTELTEPAKARYREMFPEERARLDEPTWTYLWRARETGCEIRSPENTPLIKSHKQLLDTVFCILLQAHFVNSPFDELKISSENVARRADRVLISTGNSPDLGIFVDPDKFVIETRTRTLGALLASYSEKGGHDSWVRERWLPDRLEQRNEKSVVVVDAIDYGPLAIYGRTMIQGFNISLGEHQAALHTRVRLSGCVTPSN
jgi:hypothetical protein